jgi:hypothetical protein
MSEKDMRHTFIKLAAPLDPKPIENIVGIGTPDVWIVPGAVELKWAREWPARERTALKLDHYTNAQREWLIQRWNAGGGAWLLLQVRTWWLCFDAPAAQKVGFLTKAELVEASSHRSFVKPTTEQLCSWFVRSVVPQ